MVFFFWIFDIVLFLLIQVDNYFMFATEYAPLGDLVIEKLSFLYLNLVMGLGQKFLTWVTSAIYGLGLDLKNFP